MAGLSVAWANALLAQFGQAMSWRVADFCPCRSSSSGAAALGCPICGGCGVLWADAVPASAMVAGQSTQRSWAAFGMYETGDTVISIPSSNPLYAIGENDRVLLLQTTEPFRAILTHDGLDFLSFTASQIDRVFWLDADGVELVEGGIPTQSPDGALVWDSGSPPAGVQYSVRGRRYPEYFCFKDFPKDRRHFQGESLPRLVTLRKWDLFGRSGS